MDEFREVTETIPEIVGKTGVIHPNVPPYDHVSVLIAAWNEEERIGGLLEYLKPWFTSIIVCVQESEDSTFDIVHTLLDREGDQVFGDKHWGHGDASMPALVRAAHTEWCFAIACDEQPDLELLQSVHSATAYAELGRSDGIWLRYYSITEGIEANDTQSGHLRLFKKSVGWPKTMHSRPPATRAIWWPYGLIEHVRSLDEMMRDYLRYYSLETDPGRLAHDRLMMHDACAVIAEHYGWHYLEKYEWWPQVKKIAFPKGVPGGK